LLTVSLPFYDNHDPGPEPMPSDSRIGVSRRKTRISALPL
jgi:hypothetical protein